MKIELWTLVAALGALGCGQSVGPRVPNANDGGDVVEAASVLNDRDQCPSGQTLCGDVCADTSADPLHCGSCNRMCPYSVGERAMCMRGECQLECAAGYVRRQTRCELAVVRLIAPSSTGTGISLNLFSWERPQGVTVVEVQWCRDRTMTRDCSIASSTGDSVVPSPFLPLGRWYWRARSSPPDAPAGEWSTVWSFRVAAASGQTAVRRGSRGTRGSMPDFNSDGFDDLVVGAKRFSPTQGRFAVGRIAVYMGSPQGVTATPTQVFDGVRSLHAMGGLIRLIGDINGDGFADLAVSSIADLPETARVPGSIRIFLGSPSGLIETTRTITGYLAENLGIRDFSGGDLNGDGYSDLAVGLTAYDLGQVASTPGRVEIYFGGSQGLSLTPSQTLRGTREQLFFGTTLTATSNIVSQGYCDLLVSAPQTIGDNLRPQLLVFPGAPAGVQLTPSDSISPPTADTSWSNLLSTTGDFDGDGYADLVASDWSNSQGTPYPLGSVFVFSRIRSRGFGLSVELQETSGSVHFGTSLATGGDFDGDGVNELVVGSNLQPMPPLVSRDISIFRGSLNGLPTIVTDTRRSDSPGENYYPPLLSTSFDLNGDGFSELIVSTLTAVSQRGERGRITVYSGQREGVSDTARHVLWGPPQNTYFGSEIAR
ncbi:MAG: FG-GAP-like repeat-containing protein [Deltaproteobacteria bacterium]|nr:FG-GAP-like repeat-containing protein [Deltaproteobacteria bacterium]